ncbi:hypothetical protein IAD21_04913 [Abditibacteriota bacterium]|nr:hypothetical protein IAD21_04913 [Abditibacteriota bacterium]
MTILSSLRRVAVLGTLLLGAHSASANLAVGLTTGNSLVGFDTAYPETLTSGPTAISNVGAGETLLGIDFRPANGLLYAVSKDGSNVGRIYTINTATGAATLVTSLSADPADSTSPYTTLSGTEFGIDFNPVPDRLRLVSNTGQNLRINVSTGLVTTDTALAYAVGDTNAAATPDVTANAYTNSVAGATSTTLYGIDFGTKALVIQNPPNNGTLNTVGLTGVSDAIEISGFDIDPLTNQGFATFTSTTFPNNSFLYKINLVTGAVTDSDMIGGSARVRGLAIVPPASPTVVSVTPQNASNKVTDTRSFTVTMSDANGATDIREMWLLINTTLDWSGGATLIYRPDVDSPSTGKLYLRQGDAFLPPVTVGKGSSSSDVLDNGAVRVVASDVGPDISTDGKSIILTLQLTIRNGLVGNNTLFARAQDGAGNVDPASLPGEFGFVRFGPYTVTPQFSGVTNKIPTLSNLTPGTTNTLLNGSGIAPAPQTFGFFVKDEDGLGDIDSVWFLANKTRGWAHSATFVYYPRTRRLVLRSDDGNSFLGGGRIGSAGIIENSQVRVDLSKVKVLIYSDGKSMGLSLPLQAKTGLLGQNGVWLRVQDRAGTTSLDGDDLGFARKGGWNVKANTAGDAKPSNGSS